MHGISVPPFPRDATVNLSVILGLHFFGHLSMAAVLGVIFFYFLANQYYADATPQSHFLKDLLRFYGKNASLSTDDMRNFLNLITTRRPPSIDNEDNPFQNSEVFFKLILYWNCCICSLLVPYIIFQITVLLNQYFNSTKMY